MASFPSFYLSDLERKRQRSRELRERMGQASQTALGGFDMLARLSQKLDEDAYRRGRDEKADARADAAMGLDKERLEIARAEADARGVDRKRDLSSALEKQRLAQEEAARKAANDERDAEERARKEARGLLPSYVQAGMDAGKTAQQIAIEAHDVPALGAITGDEEIDAEFARLLGLKREKDAKSAEDDADDEAVDRRHREGLAAAKERAQIAASAMKPVDATVAKTVADYDASLSVLEGLAKKKETIDTGPVASRVNDVAQIFNLDDADVTAFKADLSNQMNEQISRLSGANVPPAEFARLRQGMPQASDNDTAFMAKLTSTIKGLKAARKYLVASQAAAGRNVSGFAEADVPADLSQMSDADLDAAIRARGGQ